MRVWRVWRWFIVVVPGFHEVGVGLSFGYASVAHAPACEVVQDSLLLECERNICWCDRV